MSEKHLRPGGAVRLKQPVDTIGGEWAKGTAVTVEEVWREAGEWFANVRDSHKRGISRCPVKWLEKPAEASTTTKDAA